MFRYIKDYLKTQPQLFDLALRLRPAMGPSDKFFDTFSKSHNKDVSFIQIGANDGLRWDPVRKYIVRDKWRGIFVEPLPSVFEMLGKNYEHVNRGELFFVNAAIGSTDGESLSFWTFSDDFIKLLPLEKQMDCLRKSSFNKEHLLNFLNLSYGGEQRITDSKKLPDYGLSYDEILKEIKVPCMTLGQLVKQYWTGRKVNILIIDAEGHEAEIIPSIDFSILKPEAIFFESHNLGTATDAINEFLTRNGYNVEKMGGDSIALLSI